MLSALAQVPPIPPIPPVPPVPPIPPIPVPDVPIPPMPPDVFIPHEAVEIVQSFFLTIAIIILAYPIIRALVRRFLDRPSVAPQLTGDVTTRLERIEQAVDAIAIEVERVSEAQRFQTKLMTESRALPGAAAPDVGAGSPRGKDSGR